MQLYNNIDLVQIDVKTGVSEYSLPKNVNWRDRVVDKIVLVSEPSVNAVYSPVDESQLYVL